MKKIKFSKVTTKKNKRDFKFKLDINTLSKASKDILNLEQLVHENIRVNSHSSKLTYRGEIIYLDLFNLYNMFVSSSDNFINDWYVDSKVFSYIHDCCSINTNPDYVLNSDSIYDETKVQRLCDSLVEYSKEQGVSRVSIKKHYAVCEWFIFYLDRLKTQGGYGLRYPRGVNFKSTYKVRNKGFSQPIIVRLIDMLEKQGMLLSFKGNVLYGTRVSSMLIIKPELYKILGVQGGEIKFTSSTTEPIKFTNNEGKLIMIPSNRDYDIKPTISIINSYKGMMKEVNISLNGYNVPDYSVHRVLKETKNTSGRIFDNGSIQGKSKYVRSLLTLNNSATVSLDFKSIHPAILLYWEGISLKDHDPYPKLDSIKIDLDLVNEFKTYYGLDSYNPIRNLTKKLFLCMINAESIQDAVGSCYKELQADNLKKGTYHEHTMKFVGVPYLDLHLVADEILKHNKIISKYLGVGIGNKLQYKDSEIMLNCLKLVTEENLPSIGVHDALICREDDKVRVKEIMEVSFLKVIGEDAQMNCIIEEE